MANAKDKKKKNIKLAIRYAVSVPEKDLIDLIRGDAASKLKSLCDTIKTIKTKGRVPQGFFDDLSRFSEVLKGIANVVADIQGTWEKELKKYLDEGRLPSDELPPLKSLQTKKKQILSKEERTTIERLRRKGFTIKDIGKQIHRAEKVVSEYIHRLEKKNKTRK